MAKLNAVIPSVDVEVRGEDGVTIKYRKVERDVKAGDIVKVLDEDGNDSLYVTHGAFYKVDEVDICGDPQITDDDGDEYDLSDYRYEVYEKVTEVPSAPTKYREVKRKANVGERIKIVARVALEDDYEKGAEITVVDNDSDGDVYVDLEGYNGKCVFLREYVVLEPSTESRLTVGDYAKITDNVHGHRFKLGEIVRIRKDDRSKLPYAGTAHNGLYVGCDWFTPSECVPATEAEFNAQKPTKPERLKVGEYAKVISNGTRGFIKLGDIRKIAVDDGTMSPYKADKLDGRDFDWFREEALVRATDAEVASAKQAAERTKAIGEFAEGGYAVVVDANDDNSTRSGINGNYVTVAIAPSGGMCTLKLTNPDGKLGGYCDADALRKITKEEYEAATKPAPKFEVGENVRLISGGGNYPLSGFSSGDTCTVKESPDRDGDYRIERQSDGHIGYADPEQLEKVSAEEARWNAIGRKVGEYKAGDVVKYIGTTSAHGLRDNVGIITVIDRETDGSTLPYHLAKPSGTGKDGVDTWTRAESLELIAPVESLFNVITAGGERK
ncbi:uncharacterized protein YodC (DUF2158 family) [Paenibacillus sp. DS2015]|uniref:hypothetical protein n=1 Tax=Paenibacillus sp. DS2015 TaxID=3373917 RepID=UPI003D1AC8CE